MKKILKMLDEYDFTEIVKKKNLNKDRMENFLMMVIQNDEDVREAWYDKITDIGVDMLWKELKEHEPETAEEDEDIDENAVVTLVEGIKMLVDDLINYLK